MNFQSLKMSYSNGYIYQKRYQHGQAIQLLPVIMLHDLRVTVCVCSEGSALFHINYFDLTCDYKSTCASCFQHT